MSVQVVFAEDHEEGLYNLVDKRGKVRAGGFYSMVDAVDYAIDHGYGWFISNK